MKKKYEAMLYVRKEYDQGLSGYFFWDLILFPEGGAFAKASVRSSARYGLQKEAVEAAEEMAKILGVKIKLRTLCPEEVIHR